MSRKDYYDSYVKQENEGICLICHKETSFRGNEYLKYCSKKCSSQSEEYRLLQSVGKKGKKQSAETIEKRVKNTDQGLKQETREQTLLERYGSKNYNNSVQIGLSNRGKKIPKTEEWTRNIIESKRRNDTLRHKAETKAKIGRSITELYNSQDPPVTISKQKYMGRNHICGYYNDIYYRSSYELKLLQYCHANNIAIVPAEQKIFRIKYKDETGKSRHYYPDFYLPEYDVLVEVKPMALLANDRVILKAVEAMKDHNYILVTEEELDDLDSLFNSLLTNP
jgi:hypothetical protein